MMSKKNYSKKKHLSKISRAPGFVLRILGQIDGKKGANVVIMQTEKYRSLRREAELTEDRYLLEVKHDLHTEAAGLMAVIFEDSHFQTTNITSIFTEMTSMVNDMFLGSTYTKGFIDIESEHIPQPFFRVRPGENHVFESCSEVSFDTVLLALADGTLTELDVAIVKLTAVFASGFLLTNTVKERLTLMGYVFTDSVFNSAIRRLKRLELITVAHIKKDSGGILMTKLISLSSLGSKLAARLGMPHSYNEVSQRCSTTGQVKAYAQGAQLLTNIQKKYPIEEFFYRPVILRNAHAGEIVRPTFSIIKGGKTIYFNVVRRTDYWQSDIAEKLERFDAVVFENDMVVINCEDEEMNREASDFLADKSYKFELYFTDDLASFGNGINSFIYRFEKDGTKNSVGL